MIPGRECITGGSYWTRSVIAIGERRTSRGSPGVVRAAKGGNAKTVLGQNTTHLDRKGPNDRNDVEDAMHDRVLLQSGVVVPDSLLRLRCRLLRHRAHEIFDAQLYDVPEAAAEQKLATEQRVATVGTVVHSPELRFFLVPIPQYSTPRQTHRNRVRARSVIGCVIVCHVPQL